MAAIGRRDPEMQEFWASLAPKTRTLLQQEGRRLVLSSDEVPLLPLYPSRIKSLPKYYLFNDAFMILQGTTLIDYPLEWIWIEHIISDSSNSHSPQPSFRLLLPETTIDLQCKEFTHKSKWISSLAEALGVAMNLPQFITGRGDLSLDTQLELLRGRDFMEYKYRSIPDMKDGRYKGSWMNAKPHGQGEYWHEASGRLYKGGFRDGLFHGSGELLWFTDSEQRKKYIGNFRNGDMCGQGEMKYSNGNVYAGRWCEGKRNGFGRLEEASRKNSVYCGGYINDKKCGYGIYDDRMRHERYLGTWADDHRCGPGLIVTSTGIYCEATFSAGVIATGHEGLILDPRGTSFMGRIAPGFKLAGKGTLTLDNGVTIEGQFSGSWNAKIEIQRGALSEVSNDSVDYASPLSRTLLSELQIARLDKRIGTCTVLSSNKWQPIYEECEASLGFTGNAASDVLTAWSRIASDAFEQRQKRRLSSSKSVDNSPILRGSNSCSHLPGFGRALRRAGSLNTVSRTVRTPVELISLERARAKTLQFNSEGESSTETKDEVDGTRKSRLGTLDELEVSLMALSIEHSIRMAPPAEKLHAVEISPPIHLQESLHSCSYPGPTTAQPYSPCTDRSPPLLRSPKSARLSSVEEEEEEERNNIIVSPGDAIQKYIDRAFSISTHPLGVLMNHLENLFRDSYSGIGANKFLLPHAIAEVQFMIKRLHSIIRILFPFLSGEDREIIATGNTRLGLAELDDYVSIESGYSLLHPLVFARLFPTLITLYILHHEVGDRQYARGLEMLGQMDDGHLVHFIHFPPEICGNIVGPESERSVVQDLEEAALVLKRINTLFTPGEFLNLFQTAFKQLTSIKQLTGDILLPAVVFIVVKARVPHLGAYLHFLTDFAHSNPEDEYTLVTYEAAYNFIKQQDWPF